MLEVGHVDHEALVSPGPDLLDVIDERADESQREALQAIWANKLRSFLTVLGNIVAVTSIIAVVTLIQGMNAYVTEEFAGQIFGVNSVMVHRAPNVQVESGTAEWRAALRRPHAIR